MKYQSKMGGYNEAVEKLSAMMKKATAKPDDEI